MECSWKRGEIWIFKREKGVSMKLLLLLLFLMGYLNVYFHTAWNNINIWRKIDNSIEKEKIPRVVSLNWRISHKANQQSHIMQVVRYGDVKFWNFSILCFLFVEIKCKAIKEKGEWRKIVGYLRRGNSVWNHPSGEWKDEGTSPVQKYCLTTQWA